MVPGHGGGGEMAGHLQAARSVLLQEPPCHLGLCSHLGVWSGRCPPPTVRLEQVSVTQKASITTAIALNMTMTITTVTITIITGIPISNNQGITKQLVTMVKMAPK